MPTTNMILVNDYQLEHIYDIYTDLSTNKVYILFIEIIKGI